MARLHDFFHFSSLERIGLIHETGELIVEYRGFKGEDIQFTKTIQIPREPETSTERQGYGI